MHLPLGANIIFLKILIHWICSILYSCAVFSSMVLFDMFLWNDDFKRFVISKYCKDHVADFM